MRLSTAQVNLSINRLLRRYWHSEFRRCLWHHSICHDLPWPFVSLPLCALAADQDALSQLRVELSSAPEVHQPPVSRLAPRFWWIWQAILDKKRRGSFFFGRIKKRHFLTLGWNGKIRRDMQSLWWFVTFQFMFCYCTSSQGFLRLMLNGSLLGISIHGATRIKNTSRNTVHLSKREEIRRIWTMVFFYLQFGMEHLAFCFWGCCTTWFGSLGCLSPGNQINKIAHGSEWWIYYLPVTIRTRGYHSIDILVRHVHQSSLSGISGNCS